MKQPELGQRILELRKAKGMTQEELVERCNINVRTIQRIEAGEVSPRSFTVRSIFDALEVDAAELHWKEADDLHENERLVHPFLKTAFIVGLLYFLLAIPEGIMDYLLFDGISLTPDFFGPWYIVVKVAVMCTFVVFIFGFYKLAEARPNSIVKASSILLMGGMVLSAAGDIYYYFNDDMSVIAMAFAKSVMFGALYILFGFGLARYGSADGPMALITGLFGIITGFLLFTVVLAIPGLFILTIFELLLLVYLFMAFDKKPDSPLRTDQAMAQAATVDR